MKTLPAMLEQTRRDPLRCSACRADVPLPEFTMAFQPIVDVERSEIYAYEALVRPPGGGAAASVLDHINEQNRYSFDQRCRVKAIELAAQLGMDTVLSINFLPNAVYQPAACLRKTFEAALAAHLPTERLMFEVTEAEPARDAGHLRSIFTEYKRHGMITAIDDFGAGHSGLSMLADFQPDLVKLDMALIRNVHLDRVRQAIARSTVSLCADLGMLVVAEGVESMAEALTMREMGVHLFQGYLFARPSVERLPVVPAQVIAAVRHGHDLRLVDGDGRRLPQTA